VPKNIAHIDIDAAEIGKVKAVTWSHCGDARQALRDLLRLRAKGFQTRFRFEMAQARPRTQRSKHPMDNKQVAAASAARDHRRTEQVLTGGKAIVSTGVGQHQMWAAQFFDFKDPRTWLTSGSMGTMGFGLPAAIGAQVAQPDRIVIDVDGDGSLRMNLGEMETLTTYDIPVKLLLLNNLGDGMVRQWQHLYWGKRLSGSDKSLHKKDFIKAAESDGFSFAKRLTDRKNMRRVLKEFVEHEHPAFLEVMIDPDAHVYPMIGPGMGYKEMITGDFIPGRKVPRRSRNRKKKWT
jgi:acetolactate synthase I/II/III large subunit